MPGRPAEPPPGDSAAPVLPPRRRLGLLLLLFLGVLAPLWLFAELADEVHELEEMVHADEALLRWLNGLAGPRLDAFFVAVTHAGYEYGVIPLDVLLSLVLLLKRKWREATFAVVSFVGSALLNLAAKHSFQRARPDLWESIAPETTFSFPSGHAMGSMTLAMVAILLAWRTRWRWPVVAAAAAFVLLVGLSRLYLGVHYPSDVLAGWAAGLAWVAGTYLVLFRARRPWRRRAH